MPDPILSIVMPVYNAEPFIRESVSSILSQTFRDYELIVVDDGCTDASMDIVSSFRDSRIRILKNEKNSGIVFSRNHGLSEAQGSFVAQFDADDVAMPDKFEKQIKFLQDNTQFGMIGSWAILINEKGEAAGKKWRINAPPGRIPAILLFMNYFVQSAVVARKEVLPNGFYTSGYDLVEDYKMWFDISRTCKVWNFPEYLVRYRVHSKSSSTMAEERIHNLEMKVFKYIYGSLGFSLTEEHFKCLLLLKSGKGIVYHPHLQQIEDLLKHIHLQNQKLGVVDQSELEKVVRNRWLKACLKAKGNSLQKLFAITRSPWQSR